MSSLIKHLDASRDEEAFTLIELMIVVVIIGILAAIAIPIFMNQQKSAINAGLKSDIKNTVTNSVSTLSKDPTADVIYGYSEKGNSDIITTSGGAQWVGGVMTSDPNSSVRISGTWNSYHVKGSNSSTKTSYTYLSTTGKLVEDATYNLVTR